MHQIYNSEVCERVALPLPKKVPQTIRASVYNSSPKMGNARFEWTTFKKGASQTLSHVLLMLLRLVN